MPEEAAFKEGAVIYFENDAAGKIYVLRSGRVELTREVTDATPRTVGAGEIVGLSDSLGGEVRINTARALTNVSATCIDSEALRGMLTQNVQIGLKVITSLCAELREIDEMIVRKLRGGAAPLLGKSVGLRVIADHFRRKGMNRAARYAYGRYLETNPEGEERLEATLHLASLCEKDGEIEIAFQIYETLAAEFPEDARAQAAYHRLKSVMDTFGDRL